MTANTASALIIPVLRWPRSHQLVKQPPRGANNVHAPMSKQELGESYQGATTFFSMALAKTLKPFSTALTE